MTYTAADGSAVAGLLAELSEVETADLGGECPEALPILADLLDDMGRPREAECVRLCVRLGSWPYRQSDGSGYTWGMGLIFLPGQSRSWRLPWSGVSRRVAEALTPPARRRQAGHSFAFIHYPSRGAALADLLRVAASIDPPLTEADLG